jgi:uncharacterized protein YcfJ
MVSDIKETASAYTKGAVVGGIAMAIFALATKRRLILWTTFGVIGGGYIAYKVRESKGKPTKEINNFKNYDLEK